MTSAIRRFFRNAHRSRFREWWDRNYFAGSVRGYRRMRDRFRADGNHFGAKLAHNTAEAVAGLGPKRTY